jgi:hypothetical protein
VLNPVAVANPAFGCTFTDKVSPRQWDTVPQLAFLKPPACPANRARQPRAVEFHPGVAARPVWLRACGLCRCGGRRRRLRKGMQ